MRANIATTMPALGFRRLAIIDLAGGHQPLSNENGTVWTVFNGEIYNFPALRRRLEAKGHDLRSSGDTEVLVHLYEDEGTRMFSLLRGMFALAIWDAPRRTLILARDRLGQKPLVYRHDGQRLVFASELKALLALPESTSYRAGSIPWRLIITFAMAMYHLPEPSWRVPISFPRLIMRSGTMVHSRSNATGTLTGTLSESVLSRKTSKSCAQHSAMPCVSR